MSQPIFISVGKTFNDQQETFVGAVEKHLRDNGFEPRIVRNYSKEGEETKEPLKLIARYVKECSGAIVIAFERIHIDNGSEKRGHKEDETLLSNVNIPTVWNHIEAAMAYMMQRPLLVLAEAGLKREGLVDDGYDWRVRYVTLDRSSLSSSDVVGAFNDWKTECAETQKAEQTSAPTVSAAELSIKDLLGSLKPGQFWSLLAALAVVVGAAFKLGQHFH